MDPIDFFFIEEFIFFFARDGAARVGEVTCPWCGWTSEFAKYSGNMDDDYECSECEGSFAVNWENGTVERVD